MRAETESAETVTATLRVCAEPPPLVDAARLVVGPERRSGLNLRTPPLQSLQLFSHYFIQTPRPSAEGDASLLKKHFIGLRAEEFSQRFHPNVCVALCRAWLIIVTLLLGENGLSHLFFFFCPCLDSKFNTF